MKRFLKRNRGLIKITEHYGERERERELDNSFISLSQTLNMGFKKTKNIKHRLRAWQRDILISALFGKSLNIIPNTKKKVTADRLKP